MFFFLCVCECSLTSAKSVQPDLSKVSANEASIKGESKECSFFFAFVSAAWFLQSQCSLIYLKSVQTKGTSKGKESILYGGRSLCYDLGNLPGRLVFSLHSDNSKVSQLLSTMDKSKIRINRWWIFGHGRKSTFAVFYSSAMAEMHFFSFCSFRPWPKLCFCCFSLIGRGRKPIFSVFRVSSVDDECFFCNFRVSSVDDGLFSLFFAFRRSTTSSFQHFLLVACKRNTVFCIFCSSLASETLFFSFSAFRLRAMNSFQHFLLVACKRNVVFLIFCISLTSEEQFSSFSILPRGGKYSLRHFSVFPNVGKLIFAIFHVSQCWDDHFLSFFMLPKFGKVDFHRFLIFPSLGKHFFVNACCFCNRFLRHFFLGVILKWCIFASRLIVCIP